MKNHECPLGGHCSLDPGAVDAWLAVLGIEDAAGRLLGLLGGLKPTDRAAIASSAKETLALIVGEVCRLAAGHGNDPMPIGGGGEGPTAKP